MSSARSRSGGGGGHHERLARNRLSGRPISRRSSTSGSTDPPYWACTFAALLNGANVGFLGNKPPTHDEVRKLAVASGDPTLKRGANSSEMLRAMRVHYKKKMYLEALSPGRAHERLSTGWALVAGVTYGKIPMPWRRHAKNFMKGHRITLIGWNGKETWILDPMASKGTKWTGEPIPWSVIERAWWPGEQLWFAAGHVPHATQDQGARKGFQRPLVAPEWLSPCAPVRQQPTRDRAQIHRGRNEVRPLQSGGRTVPQGRNVVGRVHSRLGWQARRDADSKHEEHYAQSQAGFLRWPEAEGCPETRQQEASPRLDRASDFLAGRQREYDAIKEACRAGRHPPTATQVIGGSPVTR